MSLSDTSLSKENFASSSWKVVINECDRKECCQYGMPFWKKAEEAKSSGDVINQAVFTLLSAITYPQIKPDSINKPFACTKAIKLITDEHLNALKDWASEISDAELQARVADVLWIKKRDYRMAQLAIRSYLKSAQNLEDPKHWTSCVDRIERAIRLARQINYNFDNVVAYIESVLSKYNGEDPLFLSAKLMELLQDFKQGDPSKYAALAEKAATIAEAKHDWHRARDYWEIKGRWHSLEKDDENERQAWLKLCETYVKEAEDAIKRNPPSYLVASAYLQKAIEAFRKKSGTQERSQEIHKILLEYQEQSMKEMASFSEEIDISQMVKLAREKVKGKSFQQAIFSLALLGASSKVDELRNQVLELAKNFPLQSFFPMTITNEMGKVTARQPSMFSNNSEESEAAIKSEMYKNAASCYQSLHANGYVEPARYQINLEHNVRVNDWLPIVFNSSFVPQNREYIYAQGLHAGLTGDFLVATHLLIPQLEHSIRYLLYQRGVITSGLNDQGVQDEHNLNTTLYLPEFKAIFGEDLTFDLQGLLVNRFGSNLRNRMAHGLIDYNGFFQSRHSYLWWLTLRLCCLPILSQQAQTEDRK